MVDQPTPEAASGRQLIVDKSAPENSEQNKYNSISAAVDQARAGDTILVREGEYRETINLKASGTEDAPITLRAEPGAVVKGSRVLTDFEPSKAEGVFTSPGWQHQVSSWDPKWTDPEADTDDCDARTKGKSMLFVDGERLVEVPKLGEGGSLEPGQFYLKKTEDGEHAVHIRLKDSTNPKDAEKVELATSQAQSELLKTNGQDHWIIEGLDFTQAANPPQSFGAVRINNAATPSNNITIRDVDITQAAGAGLSIVKGEGHVVEHTRLNDNGQLGLNGTGFTDSIIRYVELARNNTWENKQFDPSWEAGGTKLTRTEDVVVDNVHAHNNWGSGIWFDIDNSNATITNSVAQYNRHGIHYEISDTAKIYNNLLVYNEKQVVGAGNNGIGLYISAASDNEIYNNTIVGNYKEGIVIGPLDNAFRDASIDSDGDGEKDVIRRYGSVNNDIDRNIVADNQEIISEGTGKPGDDAENSSAMKIIRSLPEGEEFDVDSIEGIGTNRLNSSDFNLFYKGDGKAGTGSLITESLTDGRPTLEEYQEIKYTDLASIEADPLFVDAENGYYRVRDGSEARGLRAGADPEVAGGDALTGRWKLDAVEGGMVEDLSFRRVDGTVAGVTAVDGKAGGALRFDGDATVSLGVPIDRMEGTISFWLRAPGGDEDAAGVIVRFGKGQDVARLYLKEDGGLKLSPKVGEESLDTEGASVGDDTWHHVAVTWETPESRTVATLMVDGIEQASQEIVRLVVDPEGKGPGMQLGALDGRGFSGDLDEVLVYDRPLEDFEVWSLRDEPTAMLWTLRGAPAAAGAAASAADFPAAQSAPPPFEEAIVETDDEAASMDVSSMAADSFDLLF